MNTLIDNLTAEIIDREKGDSEGSDVLQEEREARINADNNINARITEVEEDALRLVMSTTDIGEGYPLADNTLYGVYE